MFTDRKTVKAQKIFTVCTLANKGAAAHPADWELHTVIHSAGIKPNQHVPPAFPLTSADPPPLLCDLSVDRESQYKPVGIKHENAAARW